MTLFGTILIGKYLLPDIPTLMASGSSCWDHSSALTTNQRDVFGSSPRGSSTSKPDYYQKLWQNSISLPHNGPGHIILPATAGIFLFLLKSFLVLECLPTIVNGGKLFVLHLSVKINKSSKFLIPIKFSLFLLWFDDLA